MKKLKITIDDLFNLKIIKRCITLPNGKILFEEESMKKETNKYTSAIYLLDPDNKEPKQFTLGITKDTNMKLSPDKKRLSFLSVRGCKEGKMQIFIMPLNGGEAISYTSVPNGVQSYNWSIDGKKIVFTHRTNKEEIEEEDKKKEKNEQTFDVIEEKIKKVKKEELEKRKVDPRIIKKVVYRVGTQYIDDRISQIYVLDTSERKIERITTEFEENYVSAVIIGDTIYATKEVVYGALNDEWKFKLVKINLKDKKVKEIREFYGYDGTLTVSPNGKYIVHSEIIEPERLSSRNQELTLFDIETEENYVFSQEIDNHKRLPKFSRTGEEIYFIVDEEDHSSIYSYHIPSKEVKKVYVGGFMIYDYDINEENKTIVINASTAKDPSVLKLLDLNSNQIATLWESNNYWLKERILAETESFNYENEGVNIQGWIVKPPEFKANKKYPLIVEIHGGPHAIWSPNERTMWFEFQFFAAQNYLIFYCNPRGSSGRGLSFRDVFANWGEGPSSDILQGVEQLIKEKFVDPNKLYITGGSYGGYMTAWIIGHDTRFKAAVPQRGVYNLISFATTTDIVPFTKYEMGVYPWEDKDLLWQQSPIAYVKNIKTPTRIIHSENDFRVPVSQAEEFYVSLLKNGVEAEFIRYPEEGHELSRSGKPLRRKDRLLKIIEWFNDHK